MNYLRNIVPHLLVCLLTHLTALRACLLPDTVLFCMRTGTQEAFAYFPPMTSPHISTLAPWNFHCKMVVPASGSLLHTRSSRAKVGIALITAASQLQVSRNRHTVGALQRLSKTSEESSQEEQEEAGEQQAGRCSALTRFCSIFRVN